VSSLRTCARARVCVRLNRVAFCLYFTSFLLVLFYWMETYHRNYIDVDGVGAFLPRLR
jgi:uncharacterized membrane protein